MNNLIRKGIRFYQAVAIVFLLVLFSSVFIQIIMRNIFNAGSIQLEELARFSLVSLVFLMIPPLTFTQKHIIVDIVVMYLPVKAKRWVSFFTDLLIMAFGLYGLFAIATIMEFNWNVRTPALAMPNAIFYLPITLGIVGMVICSAVSAVQHLFAKEGQA